MPFLTFSESLIKRIFFEEGFFLNFFTFLPTIMEVKMGPSNISFLSLRGIFHFHDGRKGIPHCEVKSNLFDVPSGFVPSMS